MVPTCSQHAGAFGVVTSSKSTLEGNPASREGNGHWRGHSVSRRAATYPIAWSLERLRLFSQSLGFGTSFVLAPATSSSEMIRLPRGNLCVGCFELTPLLLSASQDTLSNLRLEIAVLKRDLTVGIVSFSPGPWLPRASAPDSVPLSWKANVDPIGRTRASFASASVPKPVVGER